MKKNNLTKLSVVLLTVILLVSTAMAFWGIYSTNAENSSEFSYSLTAEINDEYMRDTYFTVPTLTVKYNGNEYLATSKLFYPDNRESSSSYNYLDVEGNYVLRYSFNIAGTSYEKDYNFNVFTGVSSLFSSNKATFSVNSSAPEYMALDKEYKGVKVTSKIGGTVVNYGIPIDLSDNTRESVLIEFLAIPSSPNIAEITNFNIVLTDIEDPNNWVKIKVTHSATKDFYQVYCGANFKYGFAGYDPYNMIGRNPGNIYSGNNGLTAGFGLEDYAKKTVSNGYGVRNGYSMTSVKLYFDYFARAIYAAPTALTNDVGDLDDITQVGEGNQWKGFFADKAYLSIESNLTSSEANYLILNVDGKDMSQYQIDDTTAPEIKVDYDGNSESQLPYGIVNTKYKVFDAVAVDDLDRITYVPQVRVYNATTFRNLMVSNGCFIPDVAGEYVIQYTAKDSSGNKSTKSLSVQVKDDYDTAINYDFNSEQKNDILVGEKFRVVKGIADGGSGKLSVSYALLDGENVIAKDFENYEFNSIGQFVLRTYVTDYLGKTETFNQTITVTANNYPMFDMPFITEQYITGNTYYLPQVTAKEYSNNLNGEIVAVDIYVDGVKLSDNCFTPTTAGDVEIAYKAVSKYNPSNFTEFVKTVKVINPQGDTFITDYFYSDDNVTKIINKDSVSFISNSNASWSFINFLGVEGFVLDFNVNPEKNNFNRINFNLIDSENPSQKIKLTVERADNQMSKTSKFYINDVYVSTISGSFYGNVINTFNISLELNENSISFYDGINGSLLSTAENTAFNSGKIYLEFDFEGVNGESEFVLYKICNQTFNSLSKSDRNKPYLVIGGEIENDKKVGLGETIVIPPAKAFDVLTVNPDYYLEVADPDGNVVYSGKIESELSFVAEKYGIYSILYIAKDNSARQNMSSLPYSVKVVDKVDPTIKINEDNIPTTVLINTSYKLPSVKFNDNYSEKVYSSITIYAPDGSSKKVTNNTIKLTEKGIYKLVYFACDDAGNMTIKTFEISAI